MRVPVGAVPARTRARQLPVGARGRGHRRAAAPAGDRVASDFGGRRAARGSGLPGVRGRVAWFPQRGVTARVRRWRDCGGVTEFADAFALAADVEGWLSEAQARRLWAAAERVPAGGRLVEIGSFRGRSAIVMASALGDGARMVAIDPHAG